MFVAKGTRVVYSIWALHRLPEIWGPDAEVFRPERWMDVDGETPLRPGWGYLVSNCCRFVLFLCRLTLDTELTSEGNDLKPFNGGPRLCLGQQNALVEASYTVARLLQVFGRLEPRDSRPWQEHLAVTMRSEHGTKVALWKRENI